MTKRSAQERSRASPLNSVSNRCAGPLEDVTGAGCPPRRGRPSRDIPRASCCSWPLRAAARSRVRIGSNGERAGRAFREWPKFRGCGVWRAGVGTGFADEGVGDDLQAATLADQYERGACEAGRRVGDTGVRPPAEAGWSARTSGRSHAQVTHRTAVEAGDARVERSCIGP